CSHANCDDKVKELQVINAWLGSEFEKGSGLRSVDLTAIEAAMESGDVATVYRNAAVLARLPKDECIIYMHKLKECFGKNINLNQLQGLIKGERGKNGLEGTPTLDILAADFAELYQGTWAYNP